MKVVSKRVKSDWSINPVVHIGNTANHWYAKNITNFKCPNIICSKFDNALPPQLSTTWGQKSFSSSLVSLSKSVLWSGPDTSKYEAQIQYSNKWGPAVIHPTETIKPHKKNSSKSQNLKFRTLGKWDQLENLPISQCVGGFFQFLPLRLQNQPDYSKQMKIKILNSKPFKIAKRWEYWLSSNTERCLWHGVNFWHIWCRSTITNKGKGRYSRIWSKETHASCRIKGF